MAGQILYLVARGRRSFAAAVIVVCFGTLLFRIAGRYDPATSFFCAVPGGLGPMAIIGEGFGGDPRIIPMVHAIRIVLVVFIIPAYLVFGEAITLPDRDQAMMGTTAMSWRDIGMATLSSILGVIIGWLIRLPAAALIGPMLVTAAAYMAGFIEGRPPEFLIVLAQIVIGASIGARFAGLDYRKLARPILLAMISAVVMLFIAIIAAKLGASWVGTSIAALLLAIAPGGLAEMSLIAPYIGY